MLHIRVMNLDDVPLGCRLSGAVGWNQLPADWHRLLSLEPAGCFVAECDGQPVGTTCVTRFDTIAWISMVLVDAAHRGRGIGTQLMRHAIAWLDQCGRGRYGWMPRRRGGRSTKSWALWASTKWPAGRARPQEANCGRKSATRPT